MKKGREEKGERMKERYGKIKERKRNQIAELSNKNAGSVLNRGEIHPRERVTEWQCVKIERRESRVFFDFCISSTFPRESRKMREIRESRLRVPRL